MLSLLEKKKSQGSFISLFPLKVKKTTLDYLLVLPIRLRAIKLLRHKIIMEVDVAASSKFRAYFRNHDFPLILGLLLLYLRGFSFFVIAAIRGNGGESVDNNTYEGDNCFARGWPTNSNNTPWGKTFSHAEKRFFFKKLKQKCLFYAYKTLKDVWKMMLTTLWIPYLFRVSQFSFLLLPREILMTVATLSPSSPLLLLCQDKSSQFSWPLGWTLVLRTWRPTRKSPFPAIQDKKKLGINEEKWKYCGKIACV